MKYHLQLLKKYLSVQASPEDIAQNLILKTCEIEEIITRDLKESIVIGQITSLMRHPNADKLNVCQVNCGDKGAYQIVCGGENVAEGIFVPVALPGTFFEASGITIAKRAMRGVDSEWMICSKWELGINEDEEYHWIWNLGADLDVSSDDLGVPMKAKFPWLESTVLEVDNKSLTNRPDLTWHFGAAVELNAIYPDSQKKYNKIPEYLQHFDTTPILEVLEHTEQKLERAIKVSSESVNTYIALEIKNIEVKKSDFFSRLQLKDIGGKSVNNWVDFANLFMNISSQPIHLFDADKVKGDLQVRNAREGELFVDLFEVEHSLKMTDIVIADNEKVLALAGVIGGLESAVSDTTKNVLVEIANYDPVIVRKTGTRLGLRTDAELRFEKNINPEWSLYSLLLFLDELKYYTKTLGNYEIGGVGYFIKSDLKIWTMKFVPAPKDYIQKLVFWVQMPDFDQKMDQILTDLWFKVKGDEVVAPIWRGPDDLNIKEDIAEEVARIWGYDQIQEQPLLAQLKNQPMSDEVNILRAVEEFMVEEMRFDQVETYPWAMESVMKQFGTDVQNLYALQNPLNPEQPYLRDKMLYNFLGIAQKNSKFFDGFKFFDIGKVWNRNNPLKSHHLDSRYAEDHLSEDMMLGACIYKKNLTHWHEDLILEMKGILSSLINHLGVRGKILLEKLDFTTFHPKKQAKILFRKGAEVVEIWYLASVHPLVLKNNKMPETSQLCFMEVNLDVLKDLMGTVNNEKEYESLQDQILRRDLSLVVSKEETFEKVITAVEKVHGVSEVRVFDLYQGDNLGADKKSISLQIKIKGDWAMTTDQINTILKKAVEAWEKAGAVLRM